MQTDNGTMKKPIEHNHDKMTKTYLDNGIMIQANWNKQNRNDQGKRKKSTKQSKKTKQKSTKTVKENEKTYKIEEKKKKIYKTIKAQNIIFIKLVED